MGFFDSLEVLNGFLRQVVVSRRDDGIRRWNRWLREDLSSRPYAWLRPDFVPPSPFFVVQDPHTQSSQVIVEPHLIDAEFRKAWMPYFCRTGHLPVSAEQFLDFVGHLLPQENFLDLPRITGRDLQEVARAKKLLQVVWMVGLGMRLKLSPCLGSLVLLFFWSLLSPLVAWPQGLLDAYAYIAMIPKADGDSTPFRSTAPQCAPCSVQAVGFPSAWTSAGVG